MQVCIIDGELGAAEAAVNSGSHVAAALLASSTRELLASDEVWERDGGGQQAECRGMRGPEGAGGGHGG